MQLNKGTFLQGGKYRIEKVLGQGGFGITYLATQTNLNRKVAIKEFFMKDLCSRNELTNQVCYTSSNKTFVDNFKKKFADLTSPKIFMTIQNAIDDILNDEESIIKLNNKIARCI